METNTGPGLIAQLNQLTKALYKRTSEDVLGMRLRHFLALVKVRDHPGLTQQELADVMFLDPNAIVLLLNELEDLGYSIRRRDPDDRRRHILELTEEGRKALDHAEAGRASVEDEMLVGITAEEKAALRRILTRALDGLARVPVAAQKP